MRQRLEREAHRRERGDHRTIGRRVAVAHAAQILAFLAAGAVLMHAPAERAGPARLRLAAFGTGYALQTTRLIMAHMAKVPFRISLWPLAALALQIANAYAPEPFAAPGPLCAAVTAVIVAGYLHYVVSVIREICAYLGIRALTIDPKPPVKKHDE
ncbi:hypothetical protein QBZ16_003983 [Prototheca wickerhamii]|uniref:Uncharacterized protein n=1 Tax=Prototheca wickerhamii TaxID=3111 RepID=A0AAD9IJ32_PROWI|nr:hypothetical protein QBZ16_003983 [Prototheca wickerhamii]